MLCVFLTFLSAIETFEELRDPPFEALEAALSLLEATAPFYYVRESRD